MSTPERTHTMAVFCDFENLAIGVREAKYEKFDMRRVLERLLVKGSIIVKKAYCDWDRYTPFKRAMHEAAFELIDIPHVRQSGKNSADIRLVVDALDLCYTKAHVDTFVIVSGDSDFSPLVSKLRENNKTVIGVGVKNSTGDIFISNCDEFIFYDDLVREQQQRKANADAQASSSGKPAPKSKSAKPTPAPSTPKPAGNPDQAVELLVETVDAMLAEHGSDGMVWGSNVKQAIKRRQPQFSERFHGFRSFNALVEEAARRGLLALHREGKSGDYRLRAISTSDHAQELRHEDEEDDTIPF